MLLPHPQRRINGVLMNKRTRILTMAFGGLILLWFLSGVAYPRWVRPLLNIENDIVELRDKLDEAAAFNERYELACREYTKLASRNGALQVASFKGSLHRRLEALAHDHHLDDLKVIPKRETRYGKTECWVVGFSVSGQQRLEDVLKFMRSLYELPPVLRIVDPKLSPVTPPRGEKAPDLVKVTLDVQALLLPPRPHPRLDFQLAKKDLGSAPDRVVRHHNPDIVALAQRKPFMEYESPVVRPVEPTKPTNTHVPREELVRAKRWPGKWRVIAISQMHEPEMARVLVGDGASKTSPQKYISPGQEMDGGILEAVNTRAVLVRRDDGIFVYGLGEEFSKAVKAEQAGRHPDLQAKAATLQPLTPEEIKALSSKAPMTLAASSRGSTGRVPTINGRSTAGSSVSNSPSIRSGTTTTPGRLSSSTTRTPATSSSVSRPPIPPSSPRPTPSSNNPPTRPEPQPVPEDAPSTGGEPVSEDPMQPSTGPEGNGEGSRGDENPPPQPAPEPS